VVFTNVWFRGHVNQRHSALLPRLERVDSYLIHCSDRRVLRGVQARALRATAPARHRLLLGVAGARYRSLLAPSPAQIPYFPGSILVDCDDPKFTPEAAALLNRPNVTALVVQSERVAGRFEELGVRKPYHVIPNGVSLSSIDQSDVAEVRRHYRRNGEIVIGYMASWLLSRKDRGGSYSIHNVDHLLDLWDEVGDRLPNARLWLLGGASRRVRRRCETRDDIRLFGRVSRERVLAHVANFDIALYPRTEDRGVQASKIVEYMGCGVPIVSYDYEVTEDLRAAGGGLLVKTPREFVDAVERLAVDEPLRIELGARGRAAGEARDWDALARRYSAVLDRHL
jgi:glycosyltransferase involved in cell wall biosynthesis